jgi:hypothetical protein
MEVKPEKLRTSKSFPVGLITVFNPELCRPHRRAGSRLADDRSAAGRVARSSVGHASSFSMSRPPE